MLLYQGIRNNDFSNTKEDYVKGWLCEVGLLINGIIQGMCTEPSKRLQGPFTAASLRESLLSNTVLVCSGRYNKDPQSE